MRSISLFKAVGAAVMALALAAGCANKEFEEITELDLSRCLEPQNLSALVDPSSGDIVTFRWTVNKDADAYNLIVYDDEAMTHEVLNEMVEPANVPYIVRLTADKKYYFKLQAVSDKRDPSAWIVYDGSVKTYALKDNLYLELSGRDASSVSVIWDTSISDADEVTHLEAVPVQGGKTISQDLNPDDISKGRGTIGGLLPATEYRVTLFYMSASRGSIDVWTISEPGTAVRVTNSEEMKAALAQGSDVFVAASDTPYSIETVTLTNGVRIIGEAGTDGARPVVRGDLAMGTGFTGDLYIENIDFDGSGRSRLLDFVATKETAAISVDKISIINCIIRNFKCGIFYKKDESGTPLLTLGEFLLEGNYIYNIVGDGGDGFDVRNNGDLKKVTFRNNTVYDGFRTFIRIDEKGGNALGEMVFENNTVKNVAIADKGLFYIRCPWSAFTIKKNLFLFEDDGGGDSSKSVFATTNKTENVPGSITGSDNFYYAEGPKFWGDTKNFTAAQVGAANLKDDPCYNGKGNFFNLVNVDLIGREVGASPWWIAYVEKVEDLTQNVVEAPHVWDFSNATLFAGDAKNSRVRDDLMIVGSEETPMTLDGAIKFNQATSLTKGGAPVAGYLTFKVNAPGSVDLEVSGAGSSSLYVALSDENGYKVQGGVIPSATQSVQKVLVKEVSGEGIIYLYSNGPITLKQLAWSEDLLGLARVLATPKLTVEPVTVQEGEATEVNVSWEAVPAAAAYELKFNKKPVELEEGALSYTVPAETIAALDAGLYNFSIVAIPAEGDIYYQKSDESTAAIAIQPVGGGEEAEEKHLVWDFTADYVSAINVSDNQTYLYDAGSVTATTSFTDGNLYFSPNGKALKSAPKACSADNVTYQPITYGGGAAYMFLHTAQSGKLIVTATVGKAVSENGNCKLGVRIGDNTVDADVDLTCYDPSKPGMDAVQYEWNITNATGAAQDIRIVKASGSNSPWIFKVEFVYTEAAPAEVEYKWNFTDDYVSAINVSDNQTYLYDAGSVTATTSFADENLYFSPNGKALKSAPKACSADNVTYQPITYGGAVAYLFVHTAKSGKLKVKATVGKSVSENGNCKLGVRIGDNTVDADVDLTCYDPSKPGMDAVEYEWDITNATGAAQDIRIIKVSGSNSPWIFEVSFVAK